MTKRPSQPDRFAGQHLSEDGAPQPVAGTAIAVAGVADGPLLAAIHSASAKLAYGGIFPDTSPAPTAEGLTPAWSAMIKDPRSTVLVARAEGMVVGGVAVAPDEEMPTGWILARLYVHPDHWGGGHGSALHEAAVLVAAGNTQAINLWVLEHNEKARRMYERRGWTLVPGRYLANDPPEVKDVLYQLDLHAEQ